MHCAFALRLPACLSMYCEISIQTFCLSENIKHTLRQVSLAVVWVHRPPVNSHLPNALSVQIPWSHPAASEVTNKNLVQEMYMNNYNTRQRENIHLENKGEKEMRSDRIVETSLMEMKGTGQKDSDRQKWGEARRACETGDSWTRHGGKNVHSLFTEQTSHAKVTGEVLRCMAPLVLGCSAWYASGLASC